MEDDDDFGDLYTDVLPGFPSSSQPSFLPPPPPQQHQQQQQQLGKSSDSFLSDRPGIDLNLEINDEDEEFGDRVAGPVSNSQTLAPRSVGLELNLSSSTRDDVKIKDASRTFDEESFRFDLEEEAQDDANGDVGLGPVIPGLATGPGGGDLGREDAGADEWDSDDSEDDLQIVLNETAQDPMAMEMGGDLDDGQNDGLGIGADGHGMAGFQHPGMEDHEWGEDGAQAADGEKKEGGADMTKLNQGIPMPPKPGYVGHGYHTFHSQFKYVRPGAAPLQGAPPAGPAGAPGQVRPILNLGPMPGRGRGDWRPPVMKNVPGMQKGYGGPGWGNNGGRGLGIGLDFTLPSHKTIFEVDIDGFEEKPWNSPSVDVTDFFNFGLTEESWKGYCKQLEQFRLASTMQSRIRVYESGRSEQAYDPDMPPELAAAAGVSDTAAENVNIRTDVDHIDVAKSSTPARPPMPTGRPIQVETGSGERLPSIDTRPPRMRESDSIIEIVCEGFAEGQSSEDDAPRSIEHDEPAKTNHSESHGSEGMGEQSKCGAAHSPGKRMESSPVKVHHHSEQSGSGEQTPVHTSEERLSRRHGGESSQLISRGSNMQDDQSDASVDRIDGTSTTLLSPETIKDDQETNADHMDTDGDDPPLAVKPDALEDETKYDKTSPIKNQDRVSPHSERQPFASHVDLSYSQNCGEDLKDTRNDDNSKPRLGSSKRNLKPHDVGEEAVHGRRGESMRTRKRHLGDDEHNIQKRNHAERHDMERSHNGVRGREDGPVHRVGDLAKPSYVKYESSDKRKERDSLEGVWERREEIPYDKRARTNDYRNQDPRFPEYGDEMGSRYSSKAWDVDRIGKEDPLFSRKQIDTGNWRVHHDKDVSLRHRERDDSLKTRHENIDNYNRRKNEEHPRRDYSEKELLIGRRESPGMRKREKEDHLDQKRQSDQERTREFIKDHHSVRRSDDVRMQREKSERPKERDDRHRTKQYREESITTREREVREPIRSGRVLDDKWPSHVREKDELNDLARYAESKRREQVDDAQLLKHRVHEDRYAHGTTSANLVSKPRKDASSSHTNHNASSNHKITDEKPKESARNKEYDSLSQNSQIISKRVKSDHSSHKSEKDGTKNSRSQGNAAQQTEAHHHSVKKPREEPATDDDEKQQSKKGRSKMERWTSHKERDSTATAKPASSLKGKERIRSNINMESPVSVEPAENTSKSAEAIDPKPSIDDIVPLVVDTKKDNNIKEVDHKNSDPLQTADQHLETVAKLKKRSERFKVPLTTEKEAINKKKETEPLLPPQPENPPANPEVKSERPPRKRRWISS